MTKSQKSKTPLVIAGNIESEHQDYFNTKVKPNIDGDFIKYIGPVDDEQKKQLLANTKAFLMPIKWEEPFGIVMIEAMACGAPVLAFRRGAAPEIVIEGTGNLSQTVDEMAQQAKELEPASPERLNRYVQENFSREVIARQYIDLFKLWLKH